MRIIALLILIAITIGCTKSEPIKSPFADNFDRPQVGDQYLNTGGPYQIVSGALQIKGAFNHPLWLKKKLPANATIEFDVTSRTTDGDIKVEAWGDGRSHATTKGAYLATSYVFIFGGWGNRLSALCRMDEHAPDRKTRNDMKVEINRAYHWKIQKKGAKVKWYIDGKLFLEREDKEPLSGDNHSYLGFNNWQSDIIFDNLKISPL